MFESWKAAWSVGLILSCLIPIILVFIDMVIFNKDQENKYFLITGGYVALSLLVIPICLFLGYQSFISSVFWLISGLMAGGALGMLSKRLEIKYRRKL